MALNSTCLDYCRDYIPESISDDKFCVEHDYSEAMCRLSSNLVGVIPLRLVFNVEHERVRYEELQAWLVPAGDDWSCRRRRRTRRSTALSACSPPHWRGGQKLCRQQRKEEKMQTGGRRFVPEGGGKIANGYGRILQNSEDWRGREGDPSSTTNRAKRSRARRGPLNRRAFPE